MEDDVSTENGAPQRIEPRLKADRYERVEFKTSKSEVHHQYSLFNVSSKGLCFAVKEDSVALEELQVGDKLRMKYYPPVSSGGAEYLMTEIRHITTADIEEFKGHCLVGLLTLEKEEGAVFQMNT